MSTKENSSATALPVLRNYFDEMEKLVHAALHKDSGENTDTLRRLRLGREIAGADRDARAMHLARRIALDLRKAAEKRGIDLDDSGWVAPEKLRPHAGRLTKLFNTLSVSDNYRQWQAARTQEFAEKLTAHPRFRSLINHWPRMSDDQTISNITWISNLQQTIFSRDIALTPALRISIFSEPRDPEKDRLIRGSHSRPSFGYPFHVMEFNTHPDTNFHDPAQGLNVVFHENLHATQWLLGEQFASDKINRHHELYRDARLLFLAFNERHSYISTVRPVYHAHPTEEDTFRASATFIDQIEKALNKHNISIRNKVPAP